VVLLAVAEWCAVRWSHGTADAAGRVALVAAGFTAEATRAGIVELARAGRRGSVQPALDALDRMRPETISEVKPRAYGQDWWSVKRGLEDAR
jgi:hypothetical protein